MPHPPFEKDEPLHEPDTPFQVSRCTADHHRCNKRTLPSVAQLCKGILPSFNSTSTLSPSLQALERRINPAPPSRSLSFFNRVTAVADFWANDRIPPHQTKSRPGVNIEKLREREPNASPYHYSLSQRRHVPRPPSQEPATSTNHNSVIELPCPRPRQDSVALDSDKTNIESDNQSSPGMEFLVMPHYDNALDKQQDEWLQYAVKIDKEDEQQGDDDDEGRGQSIYQCRYEDDRGQLCNYRGLKQMVKRHVNSVHLKKRPWACAFCPKRFPQKSSLQIHTNSLHTGDKPIKCPYCSDKFADPARRHKHVARVHSDKPTKRRRKAPFDKTTHQGNAKF